MDKELKTLKGVRNCCYSFAKKTNTKEDWLKYKQYRGLYQKMYRQKLIDFFAGKTSSDFADSKKFWKFYRSTIQLKSDNSNSSKPVCIIDENNHKITDEQELAEHFNTFFTNIKCCTTSVNKCESANFIFNHFKELKANGQFCTKHFSFSLTTNEVVNKCLNSLSTSSSPGVTNIPFNVIKHCESFLLSHITSLFNSCFASGVILSKWKCAIVTLLYKK